MYDLDILENALLGEDDDNDMNSFIEESNKSMKKTMEKKAANFIKNAKKNKKRVKKDLNKEVAPGITKGDAIGLSVAAVVSAAMALAVAYMIIFRKARANAKKLKEKDDTPATLTDKIIKACDEAEAKVKEYVQTIKTEKKNYKRLEKKATKLPAVVGQTSTALATVDTSKKLPGELRQIQKELMKSAHILTKAANNIKKMRSVVVRIAKSASIPFENIDILIQKVNESFTGKYSVKKESVENEMDGYEDENYNESEEYEDEDEDDNVVKESDDVDDLVEYLENMEYALDVDDAFESIFESAFDFYKGQYSEEEDEEMEESVDEEEDELSLDDILF